LLQNVPRCDSAWTAIRVLEWLATGNVSFGGVQPVSRGVLHCGDAAGFIHPLTGDGMAMAARSGELAAATIGAALRGDLPKHDVAPLYERAWRREFTSRLKWGGAFTARSDIAARLALFDGAIESRAAVRAPSRCVDARLKRIEGEINASA
jgi:flavin-dependent dehydrogenase